MNNKSGSEQKCDECDYPYSADPTDGGTICIRCLKEKRDHLQKIVEEHESACRQFHKELDAVGIPTGHEIDRGKIVEVVEYPVNERIKLLATKVEEQKGEIAELKLIAHGVDEGVAQWQEHIKDLEFVVKQRDAEITLRMSQLATQTERVRKLTEAIEEASRRIQADTLGETGGPLEVLEQALNQERLGDGK